MKDEYDFSKGVRGKYAESTRTILLEPDIAKEFPNSESVNEALRTYIKQQTTKHQE